MRVRVLTGTPKADFEVHREDCTDLERGAKWMDAADGYSVDIPEGADVAETVTYDANIDYRAGYTDEPWTLGHVVVFPCARKVTQ